MRFCHAFSGRHFPIKSRDVIHRKLAAPPAGRPADSAVGAAVPFRQCPYRSFDMGILELALLRAEPGPRTHCV